MPPRRRRRGPGRRAVPFCAVREFSRRFTVSGGPVDYRIRGMVRATLSSRFRASATTVELSGRSRSRGRSRSWVTTSTICTPTLPLREQSFDQSGTLDPGTYTLRADAFCSDGSSGAAVGTAGEGYRDACQADYSLTLEVGDPAPAVTITSGPSGTTSRTSATFEFATTAEAPAGNFQCRLDGTSERLRLLYVAAIPIGPDRRRAQVRRPVSTNRRAAGADHLPPLDRGHRPAAAEARLGALGPEQPGRRHDRLERPGRRRRVIPLQARRQRRVRLFDSPPARRPGDRPTFVRDRRGRRGRQPVRGVAAGLGSRCRRDPALGRRPPDCPAGAATSAKVGVITAVARDPAGCFVQDTVNGAPASVATGSRHGQRDRRQARPGHSDSADPRLRGGRAQDHRAVDARVRQEGVPRRDQHRLRPARPGRATAGQEDAGPRIRAARRAAVEGRRPRVQGPERRPGRGERVCGCRSRSARRPARARSTG